MRTRNLRTTALASREELADALQALFIAELMVPSTPLWIVTPWISDVVIIDNRAARFTGLLPDMPRRQIRMAETLLSQLQRGGTVVIACRPDDYNQTFTYQLSERARNGGVGDRLAHQFSADLHEKGVLTREVLVSGSMNLTYNGLRRWEESILLTDDHDAVTRARHAYEDRWGQP